MQDIQAIFFDIDGTLVSFKTNRVPESTQAALAALRKRGIKLFIASGRPPIWAALLKKQLDFTFDGQVLLNGQYCVDAAGQPFHQNPLPQRSLRTLLRWLEQHPDIVCDFMEADYVYQNRPAPGTDRPLDDPARCLTHPTFQISPLVGPEADAEILAQAPGFKSARWKDSSTDLIPADGGKPAGMTQMLRRFGLGQEQCMAVGDGLNDIEMLRWAGVGVAMGNGGSAVKAAADWVTDDVDADGLAKAMRHFGLI